MKRYLFALLLTLAAIACITPSASARERTYGYCYKQIAGTPGPQQVSVNCTVTVYLTGTTTLASIYSNDSGTVKANPFAADTNGMWFWYADDGTYDVRISAGTPSITPYTITGITLNTGGGGGGGLSSVGLSVPGGFTVTNSPLTSNGTLNVVSSVADADYLLTSTAPNVSTWEQINGGATCDQDGLHAEVYDDTTHRFVCVEITASSGSGVTTWDVGHSYSINDPVSYQPAATADVVYPNRLFLSTANSNQGNIPAVDSTKWLDIGPVVPWGNIRDYGARGQEINIDYTAAGGCTATSTSVTIAYHYSNYHFFRNGDGITMVGCGAATGLSTPSAPTVAPKLLADVGGTGHVVAATNGATTAAYKIIGVSKTQGYTAASAATTITTGNTLGAENVAITSLTLSGNIVTAVTATHRLHVGASVFIYNPADVAFQGMFVVATVADTTHFTYYTSKLSTTVGTPISTTGGTAYYWNVNQITFAEDGAWYHCVYKADAFLGCSRPTDTVTNTGTYELFFNDDGTTYLRPVWIPATAPSAAVANALTTTVTDASGDTTLVLADAATTTVASGAYVTYDDVPAIKAAEYDITTRYFGQQGGNLYIPPNRADSFVIGSYLLMDSAISVIGSGKIQVDAPIAFQGAGNKWNGGFAKGSNNTNAYSGGQTLVCNAWPCFYSAGQINDSWFSGINFNGTPNGLGFVLQGQSDTIEQSNFTFTGSAGDRHGIGLAIRSGINGANSFDLTIRDSSFSDGTAQSDGFKMGSPMILEIGDTGNLTAERVGFARRGLFYASPSGFCGGVTVRNEHAQGPNMPMLGTNCNSVKFDVYQMELDSSGYPVIAALIPDATYSGQVNMLQMNGGTGGVGPTYTGPPIDLVIADSDYAGQGQSANFCNTYKIGSTSIGGSNPNILNAGVCNVGTFISNPGLTNYFWDLAPITGLTAMASAGGSVDDGNYVVGVSAVGWDGGTTAIPSSQWYAVTTGGGSNTVDYMWTPVTGAKCYNIFISSTNTPENGPQRLMVSCVDGSSYSLTTSPTMSLDSNGPPTRTTTGLPSLLRGSVLNTSLTLVAPLSPDDVSYKTTITPAALTDNRDVTVPDSDGTTLLLVGAAAMGDCLQAGATAGTAQSTGASCGSGGGGAGTVQEVDTTGPITGGPITVIGNIGCATCSVTTARIDQNNAATTSAQLATVVSDETGTGLLVYGTGPTLGSPTLTTPTIASFTNATHNHTNAAGGGQLTDAAFSAAVTNAKGGTGQNSSAWTGIPKVTAGTWASGAGISNLAASTSADLRGVLSDESGTGVAIFGTSPTIGTPTLTIPVIGNFTSATHTHQNAAGGGTLAEAALALTDITTNNSSTSAHGFLRKLDNSTTNFMRGDGTWAVPTGNMTNPMTTTGDTIYGSTTATPSTPARLGVGATGDYMTVIAGLPAWATPGVVPNALACSGYTVLTGDRGKPVFCSDGGAAAVTLPQAGSAGFGSNFYFCIRASGAGTVTVTPTTSTINGAANLAISTTRSACVYSDNSNYYAVTIAGY